MNLQGSLILVLTSAALSLVLIPLASSSPVPDPKPGHMIIPYYIQQKEAKEKKEMERLRIRCQSYESGYYSDPKCENLYQNTYNGFNSGVRIDLRPGLTILAPLMLSLALLVV